MQVCTECWVLLEEQANLQLLAFPMDSVSCPCGGGAGILYSSIPGWGKEGLFPEGKHL